MGGESFALEIQAGGGLVLQKVQVGGGLKKTRPRARRDCADFTEITYF